MCYSEPCRKYIIQGSKVLAEYLVACYVYDRNTLWLKRFMKGQFCFLFFTLSSSSVLNASIFMIRFHLRTSPRWNFALDFLKETVWKAVLRLGCGPSWLLLPWQQSKRTYQDQSQRDGLCSSRARIHLIKAFALWVMVSVIVGIFRCHCKRKERRM